LQSYYDSLIGYILKVFRPYVSVLTDHTALRQGPYVSVLTDHTALRQGPSVSVLTDHTALRQGPDEKKRIKEMIEDK